MPVYMPRRTVAFTPPSLQNISDEDDDDYITDPDQMRDELPQPYRLIDKILTKFLDDTWEIIQGNEEARLEESNRVRPPQYRCSVRMENHGNASCLCESGDGCYVMVGLPNGIVILDALNQQPVASWEENNMEVTHMSAVSIATKVYLLSTVDDMGTARLFVLIGDQLYLLKILNEQDGGPRTLAAKCESSLQGDYCGVSLENPATNEAWLEFYKLPKDSWIKELEPLHPGILKTDSGEAAKPNDLLTVDEPDPKTQLEHTEDEDSTKKSKRPNPSRRSSVASIRSAASPISPRAPSPPPPTTGGEKGTPKFSPPTLVLKVKCPSAITACQTHTIYQAFKGADQGDVIGTGTNHVLTQSHMDQREAVFARLHEKQLRYDMKEADNDKSEKTTPLPQATFHFLNGGKMLPAGLEQASNAGRPTSVSVWWSGSTQLMQYSLVKNSKDLEHKADLVWPFLSPITATAVSPCTSLLAIGLETGILITWDRYIGMQRRLVNISNDSRIQVIHFVNPTLCPQNDFGNLPYETKLDVYVLALCGNGALYRINCGVGNLGKPVEICPKGQDQDDSFSVLQLITGEMTLMLSIRHNGTIEIRDVIKGTSLCHLVLPNTHNVALPWQPIITVGGNGHMLYVKGISLSNESEEAEGNGSGSSLLLFPLRSFPSLDKHFKRIKTVSPYIHHATVETRTESLLKHRINNQSARQARLQHRWTDLRQELELVQQCRDLAKHRNEARSEYAESSIPWSPILLT